jgi:phosphoenolpyruvate-protein kinase (PTS system EI component)
MPAGAVLLCDTIGPQALPALLAGPAAIAATSGGPLSHAAIVAREIGIPCVTALTCGLHKVTAGTRLTVDGTAVWSGSPSPPKSHRPAVPLPWTPAVRLLRHDR